MKGRRAAALLALLAAGCAAPPATNPPPEALAPPDAEAIRAILDRQAQRRVALERLHRRGVVELAWTDEEGERHLEPQVNLNLWVRLPAETALRAEKAGRELWLGSGAGGAWLFDASGDERVLHLDPAGVHSDGAALLGVPPLALLDLIGLYPADPDDAAAIAAGATTEAPGLWRLPLVGAGGPLVAVVDAVTGLPQRVERVADDGTRFVAVLERYESIVVPGISAAALPRMPRRARVAADDDRVRIDLFFEDSPRPLDAQPWDRVFDLAWLRERFAPLREAGRGAAGP